MITPTVGRVVWYRPPHSHPDEQPMAALVAYVHHDRLINIAGFTHSGAPFARTSIVLVQENDPKPDDNYAEWMPYQIGQAKKHEAA